MGSHLLVDLYDVGNTHALERLLSLERVMWDFTRQMAFTVLDTSGHQFSPQGATCLFLLSESHVSCHTWPEHRSCFIDVFCCSKDFDPSRAVNLLKELFQTQTVCTRLVARNKTGVADVQDHIEVGPRVDAVRLGRRLSVGTVQEDGAVDGVHTDCHCR